MENDDGYLIHINQNLRQRFIEICLAQDTRAAQVWREFIRGYVSDNQPTYDRFESVKKNRSHENDQYSHVKHKARSK